MALYRRVEQEEVPETATVETQTYIDSDESESIEMTELRRATKVHEDIVNVREDVVNVHEEVLTTVMLHPEPTESPAGKPPRRKPPSQTSSSAHMSTSQTSSTYEAVTEPVIATSYLSTTTHHTAQSRTEPLPRLTTEDIAMRLPSHGYTGRKNVGPG